MKDKKASDSQVIESFIRPPIGSRRSRSCCGMGAVG